MLRTELTQYLSSFLNINAFKDYAPNGLQVEGRREIHTIVTGVTACQALIEAAIALKADAILVHHGFFWKNEPEVITGMKQKRIKALLENDINLYGYHLPLDAHPEIGNNIELGRQLGLQNIAPVDHVTGASTPGLLWRGKLPEKMLPSVFSAHLKAVLGRTPLHLGDESKVMETVAWCTGGAQDYIDLAAQLDVDAFISGEASERTFHCAIEQGIHYFGAGHHATERYGIQALGRHLEAKFGVTHHFVDIDNPV
ncbi:Nif3-like dinuclear metal center hexameric protein [Shewanella surugensis]|uniref:Nif3-like dinuclear metal center hexameric protein n=1 Tax=Shewanella surugensis TaxID=212020 RepID=A0ABT0L7S2_9GAMM|nr:Nif3-like dinuclear metal center hexameric protein [Shewanella surugensis]MCL1123445.1 Nif3-like dinuclear metal center hexameric protein [Shewanella surugensis]